MKEGLEGGVLGRAMGMKAGVLMTKKDTVKCKKLKTRDYEGPLIAIMENKQQKQSQTQ